MTDEERVRTEQFIAFADLPVDRVVHEEALAEVARLRAENQEKDDRIKYAADRAHALGADLDRALDALRPVFKWASTFPSFRATPWHDEAAAVLAAHDREPTT